MKPARLASRLAAWGLVLLALGAAVVSWLTLRASADLARGRERLLAGDVPSALRAFEHASRWPAARAAGHAGWIAAEARDGRPIAEDIPPALLESIAPEALVLSAIGDGRLGAAAAVADLAGRAGFPAGKLYAAALALDRGDEAAARRIAAQNDVVLTAIGD